MADFVEICKVCARMAIIEAAKRIINSEVCHSYSDLNFGVTFLEHSVVWHLKWSSYTNMMCCYAKYIWRLITDLTVVKLVIVDKCLCIYDEIYWHFVLLHDSGTCYQLIVGNYCTVDICGRYD